MGIRKGLLGSLGFFYLSSYLGFKHSNLFFQFIYPLYQPINKQILMVRMKTFIIAIKLWVNTSAVRKWLVSFLILVFQWYLTLFLMCSKFSHLNIYMIHKSNLRGNKVQLNYFLKILKNPKQKMFTDFSSYFNKVLIPVSVSQSLPWPPQNQPFQPPSS